MRPEAVTWCEYEIAPDCTGKAIHTHHRQLRRHGDERPENLSRLCAQCHQWVHDHPAYSYELGFLVHSYDDPAEVSVRVPSRADL